MRKMLDMFRRYSVYRVGQGLRGRVHKISIIAGGEVSIVIRCGLEEPRARALAQGSLVEFFETRAGVPPVPAVPVSEADLKNLDRIPWMRRGSNPLPSDDTKPAPPPSPPSGDMVERRFEVPWSGDGPVVELVGGPDPGKLAVKPSNEDTQ